MAEKELKIKCDCKPEVDVIKVADKKDFDYKCPSCGKRVAVYVGKHEGKSW